ncbi:hypothetical protein BRADI_4g04511v3 [Brachypodium distachyon]|uniref:KIB1-4 beta-propeller domain-containing protein n=1 Tax=Brachypodium distachyon TaxID=15368 RepID=A0A0Q3EF46_BRADI|nr:hypothetical protein BRADI_4g04511v3 [Brachypodium distachyon]
MASADWSSLPSEMVRCVAEKLIATNDIDAYMDMRAVCPDWRSAIASPTPPGGAHGGDLRFRPRQWIMLDDEESKADGDDARLFLNVSTGRFLRRRLPLPRDDDDDDTHHVLTGASVDGLLILVDTQERHHAAVLLNPFTGHALRLAAPIPLHGKILLLLPGGALSMSRVVAHGGHVYLLIRGLLYKSDAEFRNLYGTLRAAGTSEVILAAAAQGPDQDWAEPDDRFLVESAGDLLLVHRLKRLFRVFKVDGDRNVLEPVRSLGGRALFLGLRCLSVDANKLPAVHGDCIYHYTQGPGNDGTTVYKYDLSDNM